MNAGASVRARVVAEVADALTAEAPLVPPRVGIDGRDGAGKTWFADELAAALTERGVGVVRASVDGFHHPREVRYRRGRGDPDGFYLDSYDLAAIRRCLVAPLDPGGDRRVTVGVWDVEHDRPWHGGTHVLAPEGVLVVDGIFLQRPELRSAWARAIYLEVSAATGLARCAARGDGVADPGHPANRRYIGGQRRYHEACDPAGRADWVIDNGSLDAPRMVRRPGARGATAVPVTPGR